MMYYVYNIKHINLNICALVAAVTRVFLLLLIAFNPQVREKLLLSSSPSRPPLFKKYNFTLKLQRHSSSTETVFKKLKVLSQDPPEQQKGQQ